MWEFAVRENNVCAGEQPKIGIDKMTISNINSFSPACFAQDERGDVDRIRSLL